MKATKRTITAEEEAAIDALYASPPSEFTKKRNAIAKAFAASGRREAAKAVLARKKPSSSAFVLNQLARTHAKAVSALVVVGRELERAQRGALQKEGGTQLREGGCSAARDHPRFEPKSGGHSSYGRRAGSPRISKRSCARCMPRSWTRRSVKRWNEGSSNARRYPRSEASRASLRVTS